MWWYVVLVVALLIFMLVRALAYTTSLFVLIAGLALVSGFVILVANHGDGSFDDGAGLIWLISLKWAAAAYLTGGVCMIIGSYVTSWREHREKRQRREAAEADDAQRAAANAERRRLRNSTASYKLGQFVRSSEEIKSAFARGRAMTLGKLDTDPADVLATDAIRVIREIVLPVDHIRPEDVTHFKFLCKGAKARWSKDENEVLLSLLERAEGTDHLLLGFLRDSRCSVLDQVEELFSAFAREVASSGQRGPTLKIALSNIRARLRSKSASESTQEPDDGAPASLRTNDGRTRQESFALLGVSENCSQDDLKTAYHSKVRQWHPDQLDHMAPELREYANQELARINAAYEELTTRA